MTIKKLKSLIKDLPDDALVCYHAYDKGLCLSAYRIERVWTYPKGETDKKALVLNPGKDYDCR